MGLSTPANSDMKLYDRYTNGANTRGIGVLKICYMLKYTGPGLATRAYMHGWRDTKKVWNPACGHRWGGSTLSPMQRTIVCKLAQIYDAQITWLPPVNHIPCLTEIPTLLIWLYEHNLASMMDGDWYVYLLWLVVAWSTACKQEHPEWSSWTRDSCQ